MTVDVSHFARLRGQRYIERPDVYATIGNDPGTYLHPGQGIDAPYVTSDLTFTISTDFINMDSSTNNGSGLGTPATDYGTGNGDGAMAFPCTNGQDYSFRFSGAYKTADTTTGIVIGFHHPGGNAKAMVEICEGGPSTISREWLTAVDTATGWSGVDAADTARRFVVEGLYQCSADGIFTLRMKRDGNNHVVTILAGSGGTVAGF